MKKLLWIGDAGCPSGFARATHEILERVSKYYDVTVLGINYQGDPYGYPYPLYAAAVGGDSLGLGRLIWMCDLVKPDIIVIQQDGWFIPYYIRKLRERKADTGEYKYPEFAAIPVVVSLAVDGKNFQGQWIKDVDFAVFWTGFALKEAREGGYAGEARVIPLGVDTSVFYPVERQGALERQKVTGLAGKFVVGNINRNQPRKRWDLTLKYFSEWVHSRRIQDARMFLHSAPTGDESVNVPQLASYYGVLDRLVLRQPEPFYGNPDEDMRDTYGCFDVAISTTQGEGFGLTTIEAMACRVPCIVPDWSALGDWAKGAAMLIPCPATNLQSPGLSVIGGVPDQGMFLQALDRLYEDKVHREVVAQRGHERATSPEYSWNQIGASWVEVLNGFFAPEEARDEEIWQEVNPSEVAP